MKMYIQPFNSYVQVMPPDSGERTLESGLTIPGIAEDEVTSGKVLRIDKGSNLRESDTIIYWRGNLIESVIDGVKMCFVKEEHVIAKLTYYKE